MVARQSHPLFLQSLRLAALLLFAGLTLALAGCGPEGARVRGGGAGADIGNRNAGEDIQMQGEAAPDERIYYRADSE